MLDYNQIFDLLDIYASEATQEYSAYEISRHKHFTFEEYEGSHKKAIKHWLKILDKAVHTGLNDETSKIGEAIVNRSTEEVKKFYSQLKELDDKSIFLQILMKKEKEILNLDLKRYEDYKKAIPVQIHSERRKTTVKAPTVQKTIIETKEDNSQAVLDVELYMAKLNTKKEITVKEFEEKYGISKTAQATLRGRQRDKLPSFQLVPNGKVYYKVEDVEQWRKNQG